MSITTILKSAIAWAAVLPILALSLPALAASDSATVARLIRATELREDKLGNSKVLQNFTTGTEVRILTSEGGWVLVEVVAAPPDGSSPAQGWMRASALDWNRGASEAARLANGRNAPGATALTLGIRSLPVRSNRHALIIGIGKYADPATPSLPGVRMDRESATQIASSMQVPRENIRYMSDDQATGDNIRKAIQDLGERVQEGDRVFIHYSGHGTRYQDPSAGGCVEALLAYDGGQKGLITNREMAGLLSTITHKTDKLFVMYDACHSGGVGQAASVLRTRGLVNANDEGALRPKFAAISEECGKPTNVKTRNLVVEAAGIGTLPQDIIHLSASRNDEISFDDELKGGLATQYVRDCMLRDAKDLDNSGAISMDEVRICAQGKIDKRMSNSDQFKPHHLVLNGNANFVPAWFAQGGLKPVSYAVSSPPNSTPVPTSTPAVPVTTSQPGATAGALVKPIPAQITPTAIAPGNNPPPTTVVQVVTAAKPPEVVVSTPPPLTGQQALRQMFDQRDAKRNLKVSLNQDKLKIGKDSLEGILLSDRGGYVYVALAGSDNQSIYMLFPNDLDQNNKVEAGKPMQLPRQGWSIKAAGPVGTNTLLVMVTDAPRDLSQLGASKSGPFLYSLNDAQGRAKLGALMASSVYTPGQLCLNQATRKSSVCSDAFGASLFTVEEIE